MLLFADELISPLMFIDKFFPYYPHVYDPFPITLDRMGNALILSLSFFLCLLKNENTKAINLFVSTGSGYTKINSNSLSINTKFHS